MAGGGLASPAGGTAGDATDAAAGPGGAASPSGRGAAVRRGEDDGAGARDSDGGGPVTMRTRPHTGPLSRPRPLHVAVAEAGEGRPGPGLASVGEPVVAAEKSGEGVG
jgi:hypothetical protein